MNLIESFNWKYITLANGKKIFDTELNRLESELKTNDNNKNIPVKKHIKDYKFLGANGRFGKLKKVNHKVQIVKTEKYNSKFNKSSTIKSICK